MRELEICASIRPPDRAAMEAARRRWDCVAKPLGSLGRLEDLIIRMAGASGTPEVTTGRRVAVVFCADHGVVAEGVTQCGSEVTSRVAASLARGTASVCRMAEVARAEVLPVDIGMNTPPTESGILRRSVRRGTGNLAREPAMTRGEALRAIQVGVQLAEQLQEAGCGLLAAGEMGIGNTTAASAVTAALLGLPPERITGRGAGLSDEGLARKRKVISQALALHRPDPKDGVDVLSKVGGLELAGMAGLYLGGAACGVPVILDGVIACAAALAAARICPTVSGYLLASHQSAEPASALLLEALTLTPVLQAEMRLGEGSGAVALMPLLDMALAVYREAPTFGELGMEAYTRQR